MKKILNKFLLLFGKRQCRTEVQGCFRYRVEYKILFGNEHIIRKSLPPIAFGSTNVELPFDFYAYWETSC